MSARVVVLVPRDPEDRRGERHPVLVVRETPRAWHGTPLLNLACPELEWPKFAWRRTRARAAEDLALKIAEASK